VDLKVSAGADDDDDERRSISIPSLRSSCGSAKTFEPGSGKWTERSWGSTTCTHTSNRGVDDLPHFKPRLPGRASSRKLAFDDPKTVNENLGAAKGAEQDSCRSDLKNAIL